MGVPKKKNQPLTPKEDLFLEYYLRSWNGADAARKAGYPRETARQVASELLTKPYILAAKEARLKELHMETDEWFVRVSAQARGDMGEFIDDDGSVNLKKAREENLLHLLSEYQAETTYRRDGDESVPVIKIKLKLYSSQKALDMIGQRKAIPETKLELLETQVELAQHKLNELRKEEALLAFLKKKAPKEVFDEVVRVLAGAPPDRSKANSRIELEWDEGPKDQEEDPAAEASLPPTGDSE